MILKDFIFNICIRSPPARKKRNRRLGRQGSFSPGAGSRSPPPARNNKRGRRGGSFSPGPGAASRSPPARNKRLRRGSFSPAASRSPPPARNKRGPRGSFSPTAGSRSPSRSRSRTRLRRPRIGSRSPQGLRRDRSNSPVNQVHTLFYLKSELKNKYGEISKGGFSIGYTTKNGELSRSERSKLESCIKEMAKFTGSKA